MKKVYMSGLVGALVLFSGCGPSSSTSGTNVDTTSIATNTIQVVRGPILGAIVRDNNGAGRVAKSDGNGNYTFAGAITYPVVAMGGVIDIDRNGVVSPGDVRNDLNLTTNSGNVITMVTTYASKPETQTILNELAASLGISVTDLTTKTPLNSTAVEAMSNVLYKYAQDNNVTASSVASIKQR